jgi:hypothetical protein
VNGTKARSGMRTLLGLLATLGLMAAFAVPALAASVTPTPISNDNNPTCGDFGVWTELKSDPPGNGQVSDGTLTVTISTFVQSSSGTPGSFNWASNIGVDAVLVKAGSDKHNLYVYNPESTGDTGLSPQAGSGNGISHISFCYDAGGATPTPTPTSTPTPTGTPTTPTSTPAGGGVLGGNPTPRPAGTLPNTATSPVTSAPASLGLSLLLIGSLGALVSIRLAKRES